jgi:hypothetical protein
MGLLPHLIHQLPVWRPPDTHSCLRWSDLRVRLPRNLDSTTALLVFDQEWLKELTGIVDHHFALIRPIVKNGP